MLLCGPLVYDVNMSGYVCDRYIGLAVGDTVLRSVVIDGKKKRISALVEQPIQGHVLNGGKIINPELFKKTLYELIKKGNKGASCISISLPEKYALTRELTFPSLSDKEIEEAVRWQAKNIFPLPLDEMYLDWKVISGEQNQKEIFVVALPKRLVDDLVSIVTSLGLRPVNVQTSATCLGRLLQSKGNKLQALVNLSDDGITSTLVKGRLTKLTATDEYVEDKDVGACTLNTIEKLLTFYNAKHSQELSLEHVWLTGVRSTDEVKEKIKKELKVKVDYLEGPIRLEDKRKMLAFSEALAIGLSPIKPPSSDQTINLIPKPVEQYYESSEEVERIKHWEKTVVSTLSVGLIIAISSYLFLFFQAKTLVANTPSEFLTADGSGETVVQEGADSTEVQLRKINKEVDKFLVLSELKTTPRKLLEMLPELVVPGVDVSSWRYVAKDKMILIDGTTASRDQLLLYQKNIEARDEFSVAVIPLENLEKRSNFAFSIKAYLNEE